MPSKQFEDMTWKERVEHLWDLKDIWEQKLRETLDMEQVWEEDILLFGRFKIGTKIKRKRWRLKKTNPER